MLVRNSISNQTYFIIKERILHGDYPLGSSINITRIANELGISNIPAREALAKLESENLVIKSNARYHVMSLTNKFNDDLDQFAAVLMVGGLDLCEKKNKLVQLSEELHSAISYQFRTREAESIYEYVCAAVEFDRTFVRVSENKIFESQFDSISVFMHLTVLHKHRKRPDISINEHRKILDAIDVMNIPLARQLLIQHYDKPLSVYPVNESNEILTY